MKKNLIIFAVICIINIYFVDCVQAATTVTSIVSSGPNPVGRYKKFEVTFNISRTFPGLPPSDNPPAADVPQAFAPYYYYDPAQGGYALEGITIDGHFTSPSGRQIIQPAFYYQTYSGSGTNLTPGSTYNWKIRFAPEEIGTYTYYISIQDKNGSSTYTPQNPNFTSTTSTSKGFIRVSTTDPRFMEFDNGESFIPIGSGHQWWLHDAGRTNEYVSTFNNFGANGINLVRVWDQQDGYNHTIEGHFDRYSYEHCYNCADALNDTRPTDSGNSSQMASIKKGTQMNQRGGYEEDIIIQAAETNGVYIELCSHDDAYWIWDASTFNPPDGAGANYNDTAHINYWKRNFRYRVARWGYSTSVLSWEIFNEVDNESSDIMSFYQTYGNYQTTVDPYRHLRTTSRGSQNYSPTFWTQTGTFDIANYHDYMRSHYSADLMNDEVNFVQRFAWCLGTKGTYCDGLGLRSGTWTGDYKPWIWGEIDVDDGSWQNPVAKVKSGGARIRLLHNTAWTGLFSPIGTTPLDWYWDREDASTTTSRYADRKATAAFFNGMDYDGGKFTHFMSSNFKPPGYGGETINPGDSSDRVLVMRRNDKKAAYLWIVDSASTWNNYPNTPSVSTNISVGNLLSEPYKVQVWNTHTGQVVSTTTVNGPTVTVPSVSGLTEDAAVKIESTNGVPIVSPSPSPSTKPGDVNNDGSVNATDIKLILSAWLGSSCSSGNCNLNGDSKINALDLGIVIVNWGR